MLSYIHAYTLLHCITISTIYLWFQLGRYQNLTKSCLKPYSFQRRWRTSQVIFMCSSSVLVNMRMPSRYTMTCPLVINSSNILSIMVWNMAGLLVSLKNMTRGLKSSWLVQNAAIHSSPSFILTLLKPQQTSSLVEYLAPWSFLTNLEMRGSVTVQ